MTRHNRLWLHVVLLLLTLVTTTALGGRLAYDFHGNLAPLSEEDAAAFQRVFTEPRWLLAGMAYSLPLLVILMAHEMGHYFACLFYRVDASLPYFIPFPVPIGTLGAFIRIRSNILTRAALFDIGIAGPLAGFLFALPVFAAGVAWSKVAPGIGAEGDLFFGAPLLQQGLCGLLFPGVPAVDIYLHPAARAAWVGAFATALNLLPIGQLDGGHILYSFAENRHRWLSWIFVAALIPLGLRYSLSWLVWAALIAVFGMRSHPPIHDCSGLGRGRIALSLLAVVIFVLCFTAAPIATAEAAS